MPQAIEIGKLRQMGLSEDDIAAHIGTPRKTFAYRLKKARQLLEKEFPEFF
jgi:transcriptional regulator